MKRIWDLYYNSRTRPIYHDTQVCETLRAAQRDMMQGMQQASIVAGMTLMHHFRSSGSLADQQREKQDYINMINSLSFGRQGPPA